MEMALVDDVEEDVRGIGAIAEIADFVDDGTWGCVYTGRSFEGDPGAPRW